MICRGKNWDVDELHVNDPDHIPTSSEWLLERSVAKESEPCSTEMEQSSIEDTHAKQFEIRTNPVNKYAEEVILIEGRKWNDIPACQHLRGHIFEAEVSKLVMTLVRHYDQHERDTDGAVHWKSMDPKLRKAFQKAGGQKLSDSDWFQYIYEGSNKTRFQYCKNSKKCLRAHSCYSRTHWCERDGA